MNITKAAVKTALRLSTDVEVARFFKTTKQAVGRWRDNDPLPERRQWQLRALRPDIWNAHAVESTDAAETTTPEARAA